MKIKNTFQLAVVDKTSDERYTANGVLIDAENFLVDSIQGENGGVGKNVPGNVKVSNYNIAGAKTIGAGKNVGTNCIYNFVKGTNHDYVIEYNEQTQVSTIVLQSTTGGVLNFDYDKRILNVEVFTDADGNGDLLAWCGDDNPPRIVNITRAKTWAIDGFSDTEISVMKPSPIFAPSIVLTTSVDGVENNFLNDRFICFATRFKYADGFISAPSSWTRVAFEPRQFKLDYQTYENNGMLNLSNACNVSFNTGTREVVQVDLLFRESNTTTIYVIEQFNKLQQGWADNSTQMVQFSKSKVYTVLPDDQFYRNYDNVPLQAFCQAQFGNRLGYANYLEGYDLGVDIDFDVEILSTDAIQDEIDGDIIDFIDVTTYENKIDFTEGIIDGGTPPDQMDYVNNKLEVDTTGGAFVKIQLQITPDATYQSTLYDLTIKRGSTVVKSWTGLSGNITRNEDFGTDGDYYMFLTSDEGMLYECEMTYTLYNVVPTPIWRYKYFAHHQLAYPKNGGYGATLVGDTIIARSVEFDMTGFVFSSGKQIRINFELNSSLAENFTPSVTFFYNITANYLNLADFIANSSFLDQLENVFSLTFRNNEISNEGTVDTYVGFDVSISGSILSITTPQVDYTITEPNGDVVKPEFYLITDANLQTASTSAFTSLHSNRDYEAVLIYLDAQGRKTTALNCLNNTVFIPADFSDLTNRMQITLNSNPPSWAKYYKFAIKQTKRDYEIIYGNKVYKEGVYRWIRVEAGNKGKVKEGDVLTVKSDYSGPLETLQKVKVLDVVDQQANFITGNLIGSGDELLEDAGLYFKIKQGDFNINIDQDSFQSYAGNGKRRYATRSFVTTKPPFGAVDPATSAFTPTPVKAGTQIRFFIEVKAFGSIAFNSTLEIITTAQEDYASMQLWFEAEIENLGEFQSYANASLKDWQFGADGRDFQVKPYRDGTASRDIMTNVSFDVNFAGGTLVFETEPIEQLSSPYFETPETYTITNGQHDTPVVVLNDGFNCFSFGNGVESYKIQDQLTTKSFSIDSNPTDVNKEGYKQVRRFADITYSGVYNSNTNINKLNEFNLSLANFKDDIEKSYGSIQKIYGRDTNLDVKQEDKCSIVLYGKDLLYNADGTTNLTGVPEVLKQQVTEKGEYGISMNPDSYDIFGNNTYFTDIKRGVVMKHNFNNGLFEISSQYMRSYFKELFRDNNITHINGKYDQYLDFYFLNIQYGEGQYETWIYSDRDNGWLGRQTFNPEDMIRINNAFISFKNGEVYLHNQGSNFNTFYGEEFDSKFSFNFSQEPSVRKHFKNIEIEGSTDAEIGLTTDLNEGYINQADFEKKEGVYYAYVRNSDNNIDTALLSTQGIGNATISGTTLSFDFELDTIISLGDQIRNQNLDLVGTILSKTDTTLVLDTVNNLADGDYILCSKPQSIENDCLTGYYMRVDVTFRNTNYVEIYALNSEVSKSNP